MKSRERCSTIARPHLQFKLPIRWNFEIQLAKLVPRIAASAIALVETPPRLADKFDPSLLFLFCPLELTLKRKHRLFRKRWTRYNPPCIISRRTTTTFSLTRRGGNVQFYSGWFRLSPAIKFSRNCEAWNNWRTNCIFLFFFLRIIIDIFFLIDWISVELRENLNN